MRQMFPCSHCRVCLEVDEGEQVEVEVVKEKVGEEEEQDIEEMVEVVDKGGVG